MKVEITILKSMTSVDQEDSFMQSESSKVLKSQSNDYNDAEQINKIGNKNKSRQLSENSSNFLSKRIDRPFLEAKIQMKNMNETMKSVRSIASFKSSRLESIANSDCRQEDEDDDEDTPSVKPKTLDLKQVAHTRAKSDILNVAAPLDRSNSLSSDRIP